MMSLGPVIVGSALVGAILGGLAVYATSQPSERDELCGKAIAAVIGGTDPRDIRIATFLVKKLGCRMVYRF